MAGTGILIEIENNEVKETSLGVMTAAAGQEISALVLGHGASPGVNEKLAEYGAKNIVGITAEGDFSVSPDMQAHMLAAAVKEYGFDTLLGTASAKGQDLFARLAAILDEPLVSDCVQINIAEKTAKKSHFSGKTFATLKVTGSVFLCTLRPNSIEPVAAPAAGDIIEFKADVTDPGRIKIVETKKASTDMPDLTEAPVVITGGRAIGSAENYKCLKTVPRKSVPVWGPHGLPWMRDMHPIPFRWVRPVRP
jgi:electron transfer flavoprotein alpha subunit